MKRSSLFAVLAVVAAVSTFAADAEAVLHPTLGRFIQRDGGPGSAMRIGTGGAAPVGIAPVESFVPRDPTATNRYADGMNLYQYVRSSPVKYVDFSGFQAHQPGSQPAPGPASQPGAPAKPPVPDWSLADVAKGIVTITKGTGCPRPVECIFSYSKRTVCCTDGQYSYCCEAISGRDKHMNNPNSQGVKDHGPVPVGEYSVAPARINKGVYWHNLRKKVHGKHVGYTDKVDPGGRNAFGFHPGTVSAGCVTVLNNDTNGKMAKPYGNQCFKNISFLISQSRYGDSDDNGGARLFVQE